VESQAYHKSCFKCSHGGCPITPSNYAALEGILYCKHHFSQLFKEKGSYNHLIKSASVKRAATSVPESWMFPLFYFERRRSFGLSSSKCVFVCVVFFSSFIIVPSLLHHFSDIYSYMHGVQILCDLFIYQKHIRYWQMRDWLAKCIFPIWWCSFSLHFLPDAIIYIYLLYILEDWEV
jgi:hypothetical protein